MSDPEENEKDNGLVLEAYKQKNEWARAYMNLRLRHFAAFAIVMVFVASAGFKIENLTSYRTYIVLFGVIVTVLFWLLDYRTGELLKSHINECKRMESCFLIPDMPEVPASTPKYLKASTVTNLIFSSILCGWILLFSVCAFKDTDKSPGKEMDHKANNAFLENSANKVNSLGHIPATLVCGECHKPHVAPMRR